MHTCILIIFSLQGHLDDKMDSSSNQRSIISLMKRMKNAAIRSMDDADLSSIISIYAKHQTDSQMEKKQRPLISNSSYVGSFNDHGERDKTSSAFISFSESYTASMCYFDKKDFSFEVLGSEELGDDLIESELNTSQQLYNTVNEILYDEHSLPSQKIEQILNVYKRDTLDNCNASVAGLNSNSTPTDLLSSLLNESRSLDYRHQFFEDQLKFVGRLTSVSSFVRSLNLGRDKETKVKVVSKCLRYLNSTLTKHLYLPMIPKDGKYYRILRITFNECIALNSKERVPIMLFLEAVLDSGDLDYDSDNDIEISKLEQEGQVVTKENKAIEICEDWLGSSNTSRKKTTNLDTIFGEQWTVKKSRIREKSPIGRKIINWDLVSVIIKSGDDLRQEQLASCLIKRFYDIFSSSKLNLWVRPFEVLAISSDSGFIETIHDTISIDALRDTSNNLREHFLESYGNGTREFKIAQQNFVQSLAGYSLVCYLLAIKDRHNGNILIDREGHLIHIDYGFILTTSPGSLRFERAPFKLTSEYIEVMGGKREDNPVYNEFYNLFEQGFLEVRKNWSEFVAIVESMKLGSKMPCLKSPDTIKEFKDRFKLDLSDGAAREYARKLIKLSLDNFTTTSYDEYQFLTNKIK